MQKTIARIKAIEYDPVKEPKQIEVAYLLNLEAKVKAIKKRMDNDAECQKPDDPSALEKRGVGRG